MYKQMNKYNNKNKLINNNKERWSYVRPHKSILLQFRNDCIRIRFPAKKTLHKGYYGRLLY